MADEKETPPGPLVEVTGINLKGWEKPVEKLVVSLGAAIAKLYEPRGIRKHAEARADAAITMAETQFHILDLQQRAEHRRIDLENRRQINIENIAAKARTALPDHVAPEPVEDDWIYQFINHSQDVGNESMQRVWGKILAGEVALPGSFSLRSLRTVADLQMRDAELFTKVCSMIWADAAQKKFPVVFDRSNPAVKKIIEDDDLFQLEHAGLIRMAEIAGYSLTLTEISETDNYSMSYFGNKFAFAGIRVGGKIPLGSVILTTVGSELATIAGAEPSDDYLEAALKDWRTKHGLTVVAA